MKAFELVWLFSDFGEVVPPHKGEDEPDQQDQENQRTSLQEEDRGKEHRVHFDASEFFKNGLMPRK